jgi:hypothetical protein
MSLKQAAEELLKLADEIEGDASQVTQFVCDTCNHTATLAAINQKRKEASKEAGENVTVSDITVNDKIHCPACEGVMAYSETSESAPYYYDTDKEAAAHSEKTETPKDEAAESLETQEEERKKGVHASIDYDSLQRYKK